MIRDTFLNVRLNASERQLATAVADRLERNGSDLVRYLLRKEARELGVIPAAPKEDRHVAQSAT
jgi:antitoxin component of RelBE/YafQ-DinJ toxin-antitoxin module